MAKQKNERTRGASFAAGGTGHMVKPQAAGPAKPAITGKIQSPAPGAKRASGGPRTTGVALAKPAAPGRTAPPTKGR
jgi:hypothetical protein